MISNNQFRSLIKKFKTVFKFENLSASICSFTIKIQQLTSINMLEATRCNVRSMLGEKKCKKMIVSVQARFIIISNNVIIMFAKIIKGRSKKWE